MSEKPDMNVQTFAEQIAVMQARHHEREKELLELVEIVEEMRKHRMNKDYELAMIKSQELARKHK